ncbi:MAG: DnaJ C-terminal domain-containing protein [Patescibacteria group bacterium]
MAKDYYQILGVSKTASDDEIKKAFRRLAHEHHPDKGGDPLKFKDASEAYSVLSDKQKRVTYDRFGSGAFENGGAAPGGFGGFPGGAQGFDFGNINFNGQDFGDLGDVLGEMFGFSGRGGGGRQKRGRNIEMDVELSFREAIFGVEKSVKLYRQTVCHACKGEGAESGSKVVECAKCGGSGQIKQAQRTMFGTFQSVAVCPDCNGRGKKPEKICRVCHGYGVEKREETVNLRIPSGVDADTVLQVADQGETPTNAGRPGDLLVRVHVKNDPHFERDGHELLSVERVPFSILALGGNIEAETIDGKETIKISEGTPTGSVITLEGKGVPFARGGRGDHHVRLEADVPRKLTREQKKALEEMKEQGL